MADYASPRSTDSNLTVVVADEESIKVKHQQEEEWKPSKHELLIMISLSIISCMVALDACIIITSLSSIVIDLNGTSTQGFWIGTSYLLANAVSMPVLASLSDIFGRPICLWLSLLCFTIGSIVCCAAPNISALLVGRSIQGIGGGGIVVLSMVVFTDIVPLRYRPKWYGIVQGAWALGNCIGPVIGGAIAERTTWRWIFYLMFPFCAYGLVSVPFLLTLKPRKATLSESLARVDWIGGFFFICSSTLFLIAVSWGGSQYAWDSVETLVPLILGTVGLALTFWYEAKLAPKPFLKNSLFNSLSSIAAYGGSMVQGLLLFGQLYYIPFYLASVQAFSPLRTGYSVLPAMLLLIPSSIVTGGLVTRTKKYRIPIWIGWAVQFAACATTAFTFDASTPTGVWVIALILIGLGHGCILTAQNFATQASCAPGEEGAAAAMYAFVRQFGMALGVGIGGSAFQNVMALKLTWNGLPTIIATESEAFVAILLQMPDGSDLKNKIIDSYVFGFKGTFYVFLGISGVAGLLSLAIRHHEMDRSINSEHKLHENRLTRIIDNQTSGLAAPKMSAATTPFTSETAIPRLTLDIPAHENDATRTTTM
ncbi:major facilitator superfamily transporter [Thozetella sp. PMI_491]|nr:major facilitator superfamily transporter [Thozetella sp. PMI_491]